jgi:hypothetical protein
LLPRSGHLRKLAVFVPESRLGQVESALFEAGAGRIGNYDSCSFSAAGTGTFRGDKHTKPFLGKPGELSRENELRLETIYQAHDEARILGALRAAHPYEEVAYDLYALQNNHPGTGSGMMGELENDLDEKDFLKLVKTALKALTVRYTKPTGKQIKKVAVCGGSGRFLLKEAVRQGADAYVTGDFKYHEYFEAEGRLLLVDAGHYETEQFTPDIFYDILKKNFPTFAVRLSETHTNPVNHYF